MCDYSLHAVASRPAKVGDKLITSNFKDTLTRGFSAVGEPEVAVCLLPGTELAFEAEVRRDWLQALFFTRGRWTVGHTVGLFRQIDMDNRRTHHDAIEFPDGRIVLLTHLRTGQRATVIQLPVRAQADAAKGDEVPTAVAIGPIARSAEPRRRVLPSPLWGGMGVGVEVFRTASDQHRPTPGPESRLRG